MNAILAKLYLVPMVVFFICLQIGFYMASHYTTEQAHAMGSLVIGQIMLWSIPAFFVLLLLPIFFRR